jgi:hypothetical protein
MHKMSLPVTGWLRVLLVPSCSDLSQNSELSQSRNAKATLLITRNSLLM